MVERAAHAREHAEREHVDLQQAERVEVVLVPLDDGAVVHRGVLDRHQAVEAVARDHEAARVLRQVAREADHLLRERREFGDDRVAGIEARFLEPLRDDPAPVPPRHRLRQLVDLVERQPERLADVAQRALRPVRVQRRRQRRAVPAVLGVDVLHHLFAPLVLEVDVDVRRLVALLADEALEQHRHARRVDLGDAEAVADRRVGRRAAPLAQDALRARVADDVVDGQEVRLVAQVGDQREFVLDDGSHLLRHALRVARLRLLVGHAPQPRGRRLAGGHDLLRILVAQLVERERAALGDRLRLHQQFGGIDAGEPVQRPQVALRVRRKQPAALRERRLHAHGRQHVGELAAAAHVHVDVAGRDQRQPGRVADRLQRGEPCRVVRVARQFARDPAGAGREACQPARLAPHARFIERLAPGPQRHQQREHVLQPAGVRLEVRARTGGSCPWRPAGARASPAGSGCRSRRGSAPAARAWRPALPCGLRPRPAGSRCRGSGGTTRAGASLSRRSFSSRCARTEPANEHSSVIASPPYSSASARATSSSGMRRAAQEREVAEAVQLGVRDLHGSAPHANSPCRNQPRGAASSRNTHSSCPRPLRATK